MNCPDSEIQTGVSSSDLASSLPHRSLFRWLCDTPIVLVLIVELLGFLPSMVQRGILHPPFPKRNDATSLYYLWKGYWREEVLDGRLPLWNPYLFGGVPFLAEPQGAALYPLNALFLLPAPADLLFKLSMLVHTWIASYGMYRLCQSLGSSRAGASLAALAFGCNGQFLVFMFGGYATAHSVASWAPAVLWAFVESAHPLRECWSAKHLILGSVFLALQLLGGHPEWALYTCIALLFIAVSIALQMRVQGEGNKRKPAVRIAAAMVMLAALLSAPQLLPSIEATLHSERGQAAMQGTTDFHGSGYPVVFLPSLLIPRFFGPWDLQLSVDSWVHKWISSRVSFGECLMYCGLMPLLMAGVGLKAKNSVINPKAWLLLATGSFLIGLNDLTHVKCVLDWAVPPLALFRSPARFVFLATLSVSVLASFGATRLLRWEFVPGRASFRGLLLATSALVIAGFAGVLASERFSKAAVGLVQPSQSVLAKAADSAQSLIQLGNAAIHWAGWQCIVAAVLLGLVGVTIFCISKLRVQTVWAMSLMVGVTAIDLWTFGHPFLLSVMRPETYYALDAHRLAMVRAEPDGGRIHTSDDSFFQSGPNVPIRFRLRSTGGYNSFHLSLYRRVTEQVAASPDPQSALGAWGVRWWFRRAGGDTKASQRDEPQWVATCIDRRAPRIYWAEDSVTASELAGSRSLVPKLDWSGHAIQRHDSARLSSSSDRGATLSSEFNEIAIERDRPGLLTGFVNCSRPGWLVFNEMFYPGWTGRMDGEVAQVRQAGGFMIGMEVPVGAHRFEFCYWPGTLKLGVIGLVLGVLGSMGVLGWQWR
jgi:hypothetical protein